jgi:hypothetical protein
VRGHLWGEQGVIPRATGESTLLFFGTETLSQAGSKIKRFLADWPIPWPMQHIRTHAGSVPGVFFIDKARILFYYQNYYLNCTVRSILF